MKPARVTRETAASIGHILITYFVNNFFKTTTFKSNISDLFPIFILFLLQSVSISTYLYKVLNLMTNLKTVCSKLIGMIFNQI